MDIADTVTVLRRGKIINTLAKDDTNPRQLARMMVGKEIETIAKNTLEDLQKMVYG